MIKVGRMAGQFSKPRSELDEVKDGMSLPSYRGDIINREDVTAEARRSNPENMVEACYQSSQISNMLRALSTGDTRILAAFMLGIWILWKARIKDRVIAN